MVILVAHCLLLSLILLRSWSIHRAKCSTLQPFQGFHTVLHPAPMFKTNSANCLFLSVLRIRPQLDPTDFPSSCSLNWLRSKICAVLRCRHRLDTEMCDLYSILYPSCITVFRSGSCSQQIRQRIRRGTVTLDFNFHLNPQIRVLRF